MCGGRSCVPQGGIRVPHEIIWVSSGYWNLTRITGVSHGAGRFLGVWGNYLQGATRGAVDKDVAIRRDLGGRPVQASTAGPQGPHPQGPWGTCTRDGDH